MREDARRTALNIAAQTIKESVSALDVGEAMGLEIRHGRCRCPIHNGHDFNCRLYPGNKGYFCHVCKKGGDVISFAQEYYKTSFKDTVSWFNSTFHLGMDIESPLSPEAVKQAENARKTREAERAFREWKERMQFDLFLTADEILQMLEEQQDRNVPRTPNEPWNAQFCEAVRTIPAARRFAEMCMAECIGGKK